VDKIVFTILCGRRGREETHVGAIIMVGTLVGLIVLIFGLVLRFDPEARGPSTDGTGADG
jgi:hypothetical protein